MSNSELDEIEKAKEKEEGVDVNAPNKIDLAISYELGRKAEMLRQLKKRKLEMWRTINN